MSGNPGPPIGATCTVCTHPQVGLINDAILRKRSHKGIAREHGLVHDAVGRHARLHVRAGQGPQPPLPADSSPRENLEAVIDLLKKRLKAGTIRTDEIRELRVSIKALDELSGAAPARAQQVSELEGYGEYEALVFEALEPFPEARAALAAALRSRLGR